VVEKKLYQVVWDKKAKKNLEKLGKQIAKEIFEATNHDLSLDPHGKGKRMKGLLKGLWSYRYTRNYRVIYEIFEDKVLVTVWDADNRSRVYD
jgi:mRNA-degrading endonuclease RelE of RelBE toxin-antitoxin system